MRCDKCQEDFETHQMLREDMVITPDEFSRWKRKGMRRAGLFFPPEPIRHVNEIYVSHQVSCWLCESCFWNKYKGWLKTIGIIVLVFTAFASLTVLVFPPTERPDFAVASSIAVIVTLLFVPSFVLTAVGYVRRTPRTSHRLMVFSPFITRRIAAGGWKPVGAVKVKIGYFEVPRPPGDGFCSDNACTCSETRIPRGTGYLYISQFVVDYRADARTVAEAEAKLKREGKLGDIFFQPAPVLMCQQGARRRGLDLELAAADAKHWWETGEVPLKATPLAGSQ